MKNILINLINNGIVDGYLDDKNKNKVIDIIKTIKDKYLYKTVFHGLHHSEKVLLFSFILGTYFKISDIDLQILTDAAIYHDIGRVDDNEDTFHGLASARKIEKVVTSNIYQDPQNMAILKAICEGHSMDDKNMDLTAENYEISKDNLERYEILFKILKDADALDRTRFMKTSVAALNEKFLRLPISKQLIELANSINENYRMKMSDIHFEQFKHFNDSEPTIVCKHGIGFNFFNLHSILKHGLLSNYAKIKKRIFNKRNFYGANNELWICVTTKNGEASKKFIENFISLELVVPQLQQGNKSRSFALSNGLPYDNGYYDDESFVFYEVPVKNIKKININPEILNTTIDKLNYLTGSGNLDALTFTVNDYLNNVRLLGYFPDVNDLIEILSLYKKEILKYESLSVNEQKIEQNQFFKKCDDYIYKLNSIIQKWMMQVFQKKFNKSNVTVKDVVVDILESLDINFIFNDDCFYLEQGRQI